MSFDYEAELSKASEVDIWILYFPAIRRSLLIDTRANEFDGPMVKIVPMVSSVEERVKMIARLRPRFPITEKIVFLRPPLDMATLERSAIWIKIIEKLTNISHTESVRDCQAVLVELAAMEREVKGQHTVEGAIVGGIGWGTLWERQTRT